VTCAVVAAFTERSPQEGPGDEVILAISDTDMRLCHKACACCWNDFWQPCLMGKFSFQMNVQFTAAPYLEMFFGAKQNLRYTLEM